MEGGKTEVKTMIRQVLLVLLILPLHAYCAIDPAHCSDRLANPNMHQRWPDSRDLGIDDSRSKGALLRSFDFGNMLDFPPGVGSCGGRYPIWRKEERGSNVSVVCVQNETDTCSTTYEFETLKCADGIEIYKVETNVNRSVVCFDPCAVSNAIPDIEKRGPANMHAGQVQDGSNLKFGWYDSFNDTKILTRSVVPPACGNTFPFWVKEIIDDIAVICVSTKSYDCYAAFRNTPTQNCSDGRQVFKLPRPFGAYSYCYDVDACINNPCLNNGTCVANKGEFTCICPPGFKGIECETECTSRPLDLLIIEDISTSVNQSEYDEVKSLVLTTISDISIAPTATNVAFMVFSGRAEVVFHLNTYSENKTSVMNDIGSQAHTGGSTFLGDAIKLATADVFTESNGDRPDAENVVLLFTDGESSSEE